MIKNTMAIARNISFLSSRESSASNGVVPAFFIVASDCLRRGSSFAKRSAIVLQSSWVHRVPGRRHDAAQAQCQEIKENRISATHNGLVLGYYVS